MRKLFIVLAAVAFVAAYTVPAFAETEWAWSGTVRMDTFMVSESKDATGTGFDDDELKWALSGVSGFGAKIKTDYGIGGRVEIGNSAGNMSLRYVYGTWNFGAGTILVGQDVTPIKYTCAECTQVGDDTTSGFYEGRQPQLKLTMGSLQIALVTPKTGTLDGFAEDDTDVSLPKIEASYGLNVGPVGLYLAGAYQTFDVVDNTTTAAEIEYGVDSYVYGLGFTFNMGPGYLKGAMTMSTNGDYFGLGNAEDHNARLVGTQVVDVERLGWSLTAGYQISDMLLLDGFYGQSEQEIDDAGVKFEDTLVAYGVDLVITLAKGMILIPEYAVLDYDESKTGTAAADKEGDETYLGLRWKISF